MTKMTNFWNTLKKKKTFSIPLGTCLLLIVSGCSTLSTIPRNDPFCIIYHTQVCGIDDYDCIKNQRNYKCRCTKHPAEILGC